MPRPIDNLESAFTEMYEFITDLPSGLDGFESDFDEAFKELENLKVAIAQPGKPLTLNQLREMDGQPVWVVCLKKEKYIDPPIGWRILEKSISGSFGVWNGENCLSQRSYSSDWFAYSYPPAQQRWIPVSERLPEYNPGAGQNAYWIAKKNRRGEWEMKIALYCDYGYAMSVDVPSEVTWRDYDYCKITNVTHWMPLPEPPEEG